MNLADVLDLAGLVCLMLGALLCLAAAIGLLRFPDLLTRMHAGTIEGRVVLDFAA